MNRAERRRAAREMDARPGWWMDVSSRFGEPVADYIGFVTSSWQWTVFGRCSECNRSVSVAAVALLDGGFVESVEGDISLALGVTYSCGHEVAVCGGASEGWLPGLRELMQACAAAVEKSWYD